MELKYVVTEKENAWKVASILLEKLQISVRLLKKLKMNEKILVNEKPVFSNYLVHTNDQVVVKIDFQENDGIESENIPIDILWEDDYFVAVNKPAGMVVHPSANHLTHTLANAVKYYLHNRKRIHAINRLDRDTSGIVLFAKNEYIQERMIQNKTIQKEYYALIDGILENKKGTISKPIQRKKGSIMEREVSEEGQKAITHYEVIKEDVNRNISFIKLQLETGRTHQIRVHMASLGTPILGDTLYGKESTFIARQALHAYQYSFTHPITQETISIEAPLPEDMNNIDSFQS